MRCCGWRANDCGADMGGWRWLLTSTPIPLPNDADIGADLLHRISVQSARSPLNEGHESLPSDARPALDLGFRYRPVQAAYFRLIADGVDSIFTRKRSMIFLSAPLRTTADSITWANGIRILPSAFARVWTDRLCVNSHNFVLSSLTHKLEICAKSDIVFLSELAHNEIGV